MKYRKTNVVNNSDLKSDNNNIEIDLSLSNTINMTIHGVQVEALVDTGATVCLIDYDWLQENVPTRRNLIEKPRLISAKTANNSDLDIAGFINLPVIINNCCYFIDFHVVHNITLDIILGTQFLINLGANINYVSRKVKLNKKSQIRVCTKQIIPPRTQSVICGKYCWFMPGVHYCSVRHNSCPCCDTCCK